PAAPQPPAPPTNSAPPQPEESTQAAADRPAEPVETAPPSATKEAAPEQVFGVAPAAGTRAISLETSVHTVPSLALASGQRGANALSARGHAVRAVPDPNPSALAIEATVRQAIERDPAATHLTRADLHQQVRQGKTGTFLLLVVDASGSMSASRRMEAVKGAVLGLLTQAYQHRDTVAVIAFRGVAAQVLLPPTRSVAVAEEALRTLPTGGRTPLPHALQLAAQLLARADYPAALQPLLVVLSDGKANVPLPGGGDAGQQTQQVAGQLRAQNIPTLVLDTDTGYLRLGKAAQLATALGAEYLPLDELSAASLTNAILTVRKV
ncbi:MAG: VWA domain-containing protein, partial [Hymenobacter sp.]